MLEEKIDELRDKLHFLITEKAEYSEVLKVSRELDDCINEFVYKELDNISFKITIKNDDSVRIEE